MKKKKGIETSELRKKDPKSAYVTCRMPLGLLRLLDRQAAEQKLSRSKYVLRAIWLHVEMMK